MKISFCVSTGAEMRNFDLSRVEGIGPIYSHDVMHESATVDNLIVTNRDHLHAIMHSGYLTNYYTTGEIAAALPQSPHIHELSPLPQRGKRQQDMPHNWCPAALAVLLAAQQSSTIIFLLGYEQSGLDLQLAKLLGDVESTATNSSYLNYHLARVFEWFPSTQFILIQPSSCAVLPSWTNYANFTTDDYASLQQFVIDF